MAVYQVIDLNIHDPELYAGYLAQVAEIVHRHGGRYLARGGQITSLGGDWQPERLVIIEFESLERLRQCYASPEYQAIASLREQSSHSKAVVIEGVNCQP